MDGIDRYHWNLARSFFSLSAFCSVVGIFGNSLIFLVTLKTRSMRSTCNMLIAICAIGDVLHQCGTLIQLPLLFDIHLEIDHDLCDVIMFPPEMGIALGGTCILCIGLDRMISVTFPTRYHTLDKRYYYLFVCDTQVVCEVVSPYAGEGVVWFNYFNVAVNCTSAVVYSITWMGLRKQADASMMRRIVRSLFIIVAVDCSGWLLTPGTIIFLHQLDLSAQQLFAWTYLCTIFINISLSIKLFIYYYTSSDYRSALKGLLPFWSRKKSSVRSKSVTVVRRTVEEAMIGINRYYWNLARAFFSLSAVCATIGVISNFLIFLATVKTKTMRTTCNFLIALCAIGDIFHQFGTLTQLPLLFDIHLQIDSDLCNFIMFPPEMGIAIGGTCILCIGLDRMISVKFPARYKIFDKRFYYLFLASLMLGYCSYLCLIMVIFRRKRLVVCEVVSPYADEGVVWFNYFNVAVNFTSVFVYSITWRVLRTPAYAIMMRRIGKSLFIIVAVDFGGWVLTPGTIIFLHQMDLNAEQLFAWTYLCTIFINISLSIKLFIYYYTSSDYRAALRSLFHLSPQITRVMGTTVTETTHM